MKRKLLRKLGKTIKMTDTAATSADLPLVDSSNWETEVVTSDKLVLVQFSAEGCAPCLVLQPLLEDLAQVRKDVLKIVEVKIEDAPHLAEQMEIRAVPNLKLIQDGAVVREHVGSMEAEQLSEFVTL